MGRPISLVTGAAGGIGRSVVDSLLGREHSVIGLDRAPDVLAVSESAYYQGINLRLGDLSTEPDCEWAADVDHAFVVAGGAVDEEVAQGGGDRLGRDAIRATIENNFVSALDVVESIRLQRSADVERTITLVSSINALRPYGLPVYSAMKAGLHGLVVALAADLVGDRIRLNCIALGTVEHEGVRTLHEAEPDHFDRLRSSAPAGRVMSPTQAAEAIVGLALDQPSVVGQILVVDVGQSAR